MARLVHRVREPPRSRRIENEMKNRIEKIRELIHKEQLLQPTFQKERNKNEEITKE